MTYVDYLGQKVAADQCYINKVLVLVSNC